MDDQVLVERIEGLLDRAAIHDVTLRYCRGVDRLDAELIRSAYHEDGFDEHGAFRGGRDEIVDLLISSLRERFVSHSHVIANQLIVLQGDRADAETYFVAVHIRDAPGERGQSTYYGRYVDRFEKRNGEWRIARRVVVFDSKRFDPIVDDDSGLALDDAEHGRRDKSDASYRFGLGCGGSDIRTKDGGGCA